MTSYIVGFLMLFSTALYAGIKEIDVNIGNGTSCPQLDPESDLVTQASDYIKAEHSNVINAAISSAERELGIEFLDFPGFEKLFETKFNIIKNSFFGTVEIQGSNGLKDECGNCTIVSIPVEANITKEKGTTLPLEIRIIFQRPIIRGIWIFEKEAKEYDKLARLNKDTGNICTLHVEYPTDIYFDVYNMSSTREDKKVFSNYSF